MIHVENVLLEGVESHKLPRPESIVMDSGDNTYSLRLFCPAVPDTLLWIDSPSRDTIVYPLDTENISIFYTTDGTNPYESGTKKEYTGTITVDGPVTI